MKHHAQPVPFSEELVKHQPRPLLRNTLAVVCLAQSKPERMSASGSFHNSARKMKANTLRKPIASLEDNVEHKWVTSRRNTKDVAGWSKGNFKGLARLRSEAKLRSSFGESLLTQRAAGGS